MPELDYASFMVRMWRDPAATARPEQVPIWIGEMESIQTGRIWQFKGLEPLLELLAGQFAEESTNSHVTKEDSV